MILPVDARNVDDYVDHVAAQLVCGDVHWTAVCGNVNLTNHVKQEGLLNTRILRKHMETIIPRAKKCMISDLDVYYLYKLLYIDYCFQNT